MPRDVGGDHREHSAEGDVGHPIPDPYAAEFCGGIGTPRNEAAAQHIDSAGGDHVCASALREYAIEREDADEAAPDDLAGAARNCHEERLGVGVDDLLYEGVLESGHGAEDNNARKDIE